MDERKKVLHDLYGYGQDLEIVSIEETQDEVFIKLKHNTIRQNCPKCGKPMKFNGSYPRILLDYSVRDKKTSLVIEAKKQRCPDCKKVITPEVPLAPKRAQITNRFLESIANEDMYDTRFDAIAARKHVDPSVVKDILDKKASLYDGKSKYPPVRALGIDEVHLGRSKYGTPIMRLVLVDQSNRTSVLLDICEDRKKESVICALNNFAKPESIELVTMDMTKAYKEAVNEVLPYAKIVIDRYHVIQQLLKATNTARQNAWNYFKSAAENMPDGPDKQHMEKAVDKWSGKIDKKLLINAFWFYKKPENYTDYQAQMLNELCHDIPIMQDVLRLRVIFDSIYDSADQNSAFAKYDEWCSMLPKKDDTDNVLYPFYLFNKTIKNWKTEIFNYFLFPDSPHRSNGPTESMNSELKRINTTGKSYDYLTLRKKALFGNKKVRVDENGVMHKAE